MRHFTLASLAAAALTLGLLTASPSMAQTPQPTAKSDKMAPAPKADAKMAPAAKSDSKSDLLDINSASRRGTRCAAGDRQGLFGGDHQGPSLQGQGTSWCRRISSRRRPMTASRTRSSPAEVIPAFSSRRPGLMATHRRTAPVRFHFTPCSHRLPPPRWLPAKPAPDGSASSVASAQWRRSSSAGSRRTP